MTDDTASIGDNVQAWPLLQKVWEKLRVGGSFVAGAPNGESCKDTQFIKDVSVHTFPNENIQSLHIFSGLDLFVAIDHWASGAFF